MTIPALNRRRLAAMLGLGAVMPLPARAALFDNSDPTVVLKSRSYDQPIYIPPTSIKMVSDLYRRMTVPVTINGKGPYSFIVDTGANQSVIAATLATELGLINGQVEPLNGIAGVQQASTTVAALQVGDGKTENVTFSILPGDAIGGLGMLGLDRLDGRQLTLDFRGEHLRIESPTPSWLNRDDISMRAHRRDGQLTLIDVDVAGIPVVAFLDSGAQSTIGNLALRAKALRLSPKSFLGDVAVLSATGQTIQAEMANLPGLRIGTFRLPNWPVAFADLHTFELWGLNDRPAILLGVDILSRFEQVSLDFARNEVRFRTP
jgi:predicted aspartyl protease